jgi:hypothetical protein
VPLEPPDGTWAVYYNFDQFLYETDKSAEKGFGLFGRFGASEGNPNPSRYFYSIGFGGKGVIGGRGSDQFGIGYYYDSIRGAFFALASCVAGTAGISCRFEQVKAWSGVLQRALARGVSRKKTEAARGERRGPPSHSASTG